MIEHKISERNMAQFVAVTARKIWENTEEIKNMG